MDKWEQKQFDEWNKTKKNIQRRGKTPSIKEGEIWWFADGKNVGVEINGKGTGFARPVLILTKFGRLSFLGIPLTTKKHEGSWYAEQDFKGKKCYAALHQAKALSVHRLYGKMGELPEDDLTLIRQTFLELHIKNFPRPLSRGVVGNPKDKTIIAVLSQKIKNFLRRLG